MNETPRLLTKVALERLEGCLAEPRALAPGAEQRAKLAAAVTRVRAQLLGGDRPVLTVALAGGTGAGKSTLINALAGAVIAPVGEERPTTSRIRVYHHRDVVLGALPEDLVREADFVAHERHALRHKVLVDTPDLDSYLLEHRRTTVRLLKRANVVLYVFSPEKYLEERTWSVLREEQLFSASAAALNKTDKLAADEAARVGDDLQSRFVEAGLADVPLFRVAARAHVPGGGEASAPPVDEFEALRGFVEQRLGEAEVVRLLVEQRVRAVGALAQALELVAPQDLPQRLDDVEHDARAAAARAADEVAERLREPLETVESDLAPLARLRLHERFWGPFRTWLALWDFVRVGLVGQVQRLLGRDPRGSVAAAERLLGDPARDAVRAALSALVHRTQGLLFDRDLPAAAWSERAARHAERVTSGAVARAIQDDFDGRAALASRRGGALVWTCSGLGALTTAVVVLGGLWTTVVSLLEARYVGLSLLGHVVAVLVLSFAALHGVVGLLGGRGRAAGQGLGRLALHGVLARAWGEAFAEYRLEVEADYRDLREPLELLRAAAEQVWPPPAAAVESPEEAPETGAGDATPAEPEAAPMPVAAEPAPAERAKVAPSERMRRALGQ